MIALPVATAAGVLALSVRDRSAPPQHEAVEIARPVQIIMAQARPITPRLIGHGVVEPKTRWRAVTRIAGTITDLAPDLDAGAFLRAGTALARIERDDYVAAVERAAAEVAAAAAAVEELEARDRTTRRMLAIESDALALREAEAARLRALFASGTTAASSRDAAERDLLTQRARIQDLENTLHLLPSQIRGARAQHQAATTTLADARRNLDRTAVILPVDALVSSVDVERGEYVVANTTVASFHGTEAAEIVVRVPQGAFSSFTALAGHEPSHWHAAISATDGATWIGTPTRLAPVIDTDARSIGIVVEIDDPHGRSPGASGRPALRSGAFTRVVLSGRPTADRIAVPVEAVREGRVFLVDADDRLRIRPVTVTAYQDGQALLDETAVPDGARVVLGEVTPAVDGMLVAPVQRDTTASPRVAAIDR